MTHPGPQKSAQDRLEEARNLYERAVFAGDSESLTAAERELDAVEGDLALARGRILHARFLIEARDATPELALFDRAAAIYRASGDVRGEGEAIFWVGCYHQVVQGDHEAAVPILERARFLARSAGDKVVESEALRHLGIARHASGQLDAAQELLEESTVLRRELDLMPGVAANLVGLIYIAAARGRREAALELAEEAAAIAQEHGAQRILLQVEEARSAI